MTEVEIFKVSTNAKEGSRVRYVPLHAGGDITHPDCETGRISSFGESMVFVKFDGKVARLGWEGTTAEACDPEDLRIA